MENVKKSDFVKWFGWLLAVVFFIMLVLPKERTYIASVSSDGKYKAAIKYKSVFPYIQGVNAFLVVTECDSGKIRIKRSLLKNRDTLADIRAEFKKISWESHDVILSINRIHYKGAEIFSVDGI